MNAVTEEIKQLKKEKNAVILAHYYVEDAVQENCRLHRGLVLLKPSLQRKQQQMSLFSAVWDLWVRAQRY